MGTLRFTLRAEGEDDAPVDAADFSTFLSALLACLKAVEGETSVQSPVEYQVVDLKIGSAAIELRPVSSGDLDRSAHLVARTFEEGFAALQQDAIRRTPYSRATKAKFLALTKPLRRATRSIELRGEMQEVAISRRVLLRELPQPTTEIVARGSLKGNVDALNVHKTRVFYLYPRSGPKRVRCTFGSELLDSVREAIKRNTSVFGLLEYERGKPFPVRMHVERVEVNPSDADLPTLASLWGAAPDVTGKQTTRGFLDSVRNE